MKTIISMAIVALLSTALAGCWMSSTPESTPGCTKTTYGVAVASTTSENCPPSDTGASPSSAPVPPGPPPLPSPGMM